MPNEKTNEETGYCYNATQTNGTIVTRKDRLRLHRLGYTDDHIDRLDADRRVEILASSTPRAGSNAAISKENKRLAKAGIPAAPASISDEVTEEKKGKIQATPGVAVTLDEFTNECLRGENPLDALILAHEEKFPGKVFRLVNPDLPQVAGPQMQQVYDADRKAIGAGGLMLQYMPQEVYNEAYVRPNLDRAARMAGSIKDTRAITEHEKGGDLTLTAEQARLAQLEGDGLHLERSAMSRA